jgi:DNA-directed RNA polymerase I subunit RPA2
VENSIPADIELAYIPYLHGGIYPGIFLYTNAARLMRPVRQIGRKKSSSNISGTSGAAGAMELLGTLEQNNMAIRWALCTHGDIDIAVSVSDM